jgi:hypothetical protein
MEDSFDAEEEVPEQTENKAWPKQNTRENFRVMYPEIKKIRNMPNKRISFLFNLMVYHLEFFPCLERMPVTCSHCISINKREIKKQS